MNGNEIILNARMLMQRYTDLKAVIDTDPYIFPMTTRTSFIGSQNGAKQDIAKVEKEYAEVVRATAFCIVPVGQPGVQAAFSEVVLDETDAVAVAANDLFLGIAKKLEPSLGVQRMFGVQQLANTISYVKEIASEIRFGGDVMRPQSFEPANVHDEGSLVNKVREILTAMTGDKLQRAYIEHQAIQAALKIRYSRSTLPVVLTNTTAEEREGFVKTLFTGQAFEVPVTEDLTVESVFETLTSIRKALKKQ